MSTSATRHPDLPCVLLRHTLADGSSHLDWLLAPHGHPGPDERVLRAWRLAEPDGLRLAEAEVPFECQAIRLPDHRAVYLAYEGVVSGGPGEVTRIACGNWTAISEREDAIECEVRFGTRWRVRGERIGDAPDPADRGRAPLGQWRLLFERTQEREHGAATSSNG